MTLVEPTHAHIEVLPPVGPSDQGEDGCCSRSAIAAAAIVHDLGNLIQIASSAIGIVARTPTMPAAHSGALLHRARNCLDQAGALVQRNLRRDGVVAEERSGIAACLADIRALVVAMDAPGLTLDIDAPAAMPDLRCDPIELRRALLNLVLNARDAMPDGGRIRILARAVRAAGDADHIELQVIDEGIGMSPDTIARAFDPFFTTRRGGVGGIGLPMVEHFVGNAGGTVAISSQRGAGTVVTLCLPAARAASLAEESHR